MCIIFKWTQSIYYILNKGNSVYLILNTKLLFVRNYLQSTPNFLSHYVNEYWSNKQKLIRNVNGKNWKVTTKNEMTRKKKRRTVTTTEKNMLESGMKTKQTS